MTDLEPETEVQRRLRMPHHRVIHGDRVDGCMGEVRGLPGCYTSGDTPAETLANLDEAMAAWIGACPISGDQIPDPARALTPVA